MVFMETLNKTYYFYWADNVSKLILSHTEKGLGMPLAHAKSVEIVVVQPLIIIM